MDVVWKGIKEGYDKETVHTLAQGVFEEEWLKAGAVLQDEMSDDQESEYKFRHEGTAYHMLENYIERRWDFITGVEVLEVERPFAVPLHPTDQEMLYVGRQDKVIKWDSYIWAVEHKTSSLYAKSGYFRSNFLDSFTPNSQIDGYLHALKTDYGEDAKGVLVDGALVHKTEHEGFRFIPVEQQFEQLDAWLYETLEAIERIERDKDYMSNNLVEGEPFMSAFPKDTNSCFMFNRPCPYLGFCKVLANPENRREVPDGFKIEKWEPFKELALERIGVEDEDEDKG